VNQKLKARAALLGLFVIRMLAAGVAELRKLESAGGGLLVLGGRVVAVLAIGTLEGNDLAHDVDLLSWPATSAGKQLAAHGKKLRTARRDAGL